MSNPHEAEVIDELRRVVRFVSLSTRLYLGLDGVDINFGIDGWEGGLINALARYDAAAAGRPVPDTLRRPPEWEVFDAWRRSPHKVKAHPTERRCVTASPPWGRMGCGALCGRAITKADDGKWRHDA